MNDRQTATASDPLVRAYLQQLERALSALPQDERAVIVDEVTEHIVESLKTRDTPHDPAQVRAVLDALGDPVAIATEAGAPQPSPASASGQRPPFLERRSGGLVIVLLLLVGGLVVPVLGWFVGVVMLWASRGWSTLQKLVGTLVLPGGLLGLVILGGALPFLFPSTTTESECMIGVNSIDECVELGPLIQASEWSWVVLVILLALQIAASVYLLSRFRTATDRETSLPYTP